ncbi:MAG: malto-oligosyltrehalose synthase [Thermoleophilia bacterium]|nr:malto-oligosyltrehalose synthase [Thermoleophilia bacterium]
MRATYRLQLGPGLGFAEARELVPYLQGLGVSHLYLSPCLQARPGSTHGYDVIDPRRISADLGGEAAFRALAGAGLRVLLDIVPNHMATDDANPFWADPALRERFFDIDPRTGRHRRFFSIDELAGVRVEDPEVFETTHALVLRLVAEGVVDGLRIDHPDGLADPGGYLRRLAERGVERIWVEKILEPGEELPDWPVEGTTGYEFMADAAGLFIDPAGEEPLTRLYAALTGEERDFAELAEEAKLDEALTTFQPEVERLREIIDEPDMAEAVASLPVYRTYVEPEGDGADDQDVRVVEQADLPERVKEALVDPSGAVEEAFAVRFQQTTGAIMAKGVEDTALYRYSRLAALNEVGSDPGRWGRSPEEVHQAHIARHRRFPRCLLATQTHDTKRSGDVRARIGALAGIPGEWRARVLAWRAMNAPLRTASAPNPDDEYLIYQTLVGAWPLEAARLRDYMTKAMREAKVDTGWGEPDDAYEGAVAAFIDGLYASAAFVADLEAFADRVAPLGEASALGQTLLKLTSPGVPDIYQGDELWDLALVDPDNRRPVDWDLRVRLLAEVAGGAAPRRETAKMFLIHRALGLRARRPEAFDGAYTPLGAGPRAFAYARGDAVIAATPVAEGGAASPVAIPAELRGAWRSVLTGDAVELGEEASVGRLAGAFPVALLERG